MSVKKSALGKGLDALLGDENIDVFGGNEEAKAEAGVTEIPLYKVKANPDQPRKFFDQSSLQELSESIKKQGVLSPILVKPSGDDYIIVAGERRFRASQLAKMESIPVIIRKFSIEEQLEIALIENIQREDLTPVEEAKAYKHLMDTLTLTQQEVAEKVSKSRAAVANSLRLLNLSDNMLDSVDKGEISAGHARSILSVVNPADQEILYNRVVNDGLSVRESEAMSRELNEGKRSGKSSEKPKTQTNNLKDADIISLEQRLIDKLGTKVQIKGTAKKGSVVISYLSTDDLERLLGLIES